jgi:hypothetical protein
MLIAGCGGTGLSSTDNQIAQKDARCSQLKNEASCAADTADQCTWLAYGAPCAPNGPCVSGVCQGPIQGGGSITDGGVTCPPPSASCSSFTDETSCVADTSDHCVWYAYGRPCPVIGPCVSGVCQQAPTPGCGPDGGTGTGHGCACPNGGVCVQKDGNPITCEQPIAGCLGGATACSCLPSSDGSCTASPDVAGLCICTTPPPPVGCNCAPGQVCVQQIGGPAVPVGAPPKLICVTPIPGCLGGALRCTCIAGQGRCSPATSGPAECICDNGIR